MSPQVIEVMLPLSFLQVDAPVGCTELVQAREHLTDMQQTPRSSCSSGHVSLLIGSGLS